MKRPESSRRTAKGNVQFLKLNQHYLLLHDNGENKPFFTRIIALYSKAETTQRNLVERKKKNTTVKKKEKQKKPQQTTAIEAGTKWDVETDGGISL